MRLHWKWVIKSVPSLVLGVLMLLSTVTPRQARSNVEAWFIYFGIEDVPPWLADKSTDTWIFWMAFAGFCAWAVHLYVRTNVRHGKLSIVIRDEEPWVEVSPLIDRSQAVPISGSQHTYRIALVNSDDSTIRNVEVKLNSLEKKPENFHAIGSCLKLRNDRTGATNCNVYPTKDPQCMDALFVDVFSLFVGPTGDSFLRVASLPADMDRHIPVDKYDVKIVATSESGEMAVGDMAFIPRTGQIPELRLLKMQSFPGQ
ncbi:MAG TPA: hypothetical protein VJT11_10235 [Nitrospiraceae bacterium]|nr:hypothetical protein [Nitrospiraceae bacterium]